MNQARTAVVPPHYIRANSASRWPHRWIAWDSETRWEERGTITTHIFRLAVASFWDTNTKRYNEPTYQRFTDVPSMWQWISDRCIRDGRTVAYAHNLSFDIQVCRMFNELPTLGWSLNWFNLERDGTMVTWRRGTQTLILVDSMTIFPASLETVSGAVTSEKTPLPANDADESEWWARCEADVRVLTEAVREFNGWAREFDIGNWRPSGSGLAWSMWRHRWMSHSVLASSGPENLAAERAGMVTGRAEAWRTGPAPDGGLVDWDMARCYCRIASQCDVPIRWRITVPRLTLPQYRAWQATDAVLSHVRVRQSQPIVGTEDGTGFRWPVGEFETWLWDPEIDLLLESGAEVEFGESRRYWRAPALREWAFWTLDELTPERQTVPPVALFWVKAQSRSLIGRFGMRYHTWAEHPDGNGMQLTGMSRQGGPGEPNRMLMHAAGQAWVEQERVDGDDCVPAITGWIMSEARMRLWRALVAAGPANVYHCDTDGLLVSLAGSARLTEHARKNPYDGWVVKGRYADGEIRGTRNYTLGEREHITGVPSKAVRTGEQTWEGEQWQGIRQGLQHGRLDRVLVRRTTYTIDGPDSRRHHEADGTTRAYAPGEFDERYPRPHRHIGG